jgi:hypothetical protein
MADPVLLPPQHWRDRAEEARAMAEQMRDVGARLALLNIAVGYEKLAQRAEARAARNERGVTGDAPGSGRLSNQQEVC